MRAYLVAVLLTSLMAGCGGGDSGTASSSKQLAAISASEFMSLPGSYNDYTVSQNGNGYVVTDKSGQATAVPANIKRVSFSDGSLALDLNGNAGQVYRLYQAAFNRQPDASGLAYWIDMMDKGQTIQAIADGFANSQEYKTLYGESPTNVQIITRYYNNVLHRQPEQGGFDYWVNVLNTVQASRVGVLIEFSESPENKAQVLPAIGNGIVYGSGDTGSGGSGAAEQVTANIADGSTTIAQAAIGTFQLGNQPQLLGTTATLKREAQPVVRDWMQSESAMIGADPVSDKLVTLIIDKEPTGEGITGQLDVKDIAVGDNEALVVFAIPATEDSGAAFIALSSSLYDPESKKIDFTASPDLFEQTPEGKYKLELFVGKTATVTTAAVTYTVGANGSTTSTITGQDNRGSIACPLARSAAEGTCVETSRYNPGRKIDNRVGHLGLDLRAQTELPIYGIAGATLFGGRTNEDYEEEASQYTGSCSTPPKVKSQAYQAKCGSGVFLAFSLPGGMQVKYFHLSRITDKFLPKTDPKTGKTVWNATVQDGDIIGYTGQTGGIAQPHLHFETLKKITTTCVKATSKSGTKSCSKPSQVDPFDYLIKEFKFTAPANQPTLQAGQDLGFALQAADKNGVPILSHIDYSEPLNQARSRLLCMTPSNSTVLGFNRPDYTSGNMACYRYWDAPISARVNNVLPVAIEAAFRSLYTDSPVQAQNPDPQNLSEMKPTISVGKACTAPKMLVNGLCIDQKLTCTKRPDGLYTMQGSGEITLVPGGKFTPTYHTTQYYTGRAPNGYPNCCFDAAPKDARLPDWQFLSGTCTTTLPGQATPIQLPEVNFGICQNNLGFPVQARYSISSFVDQASITGSLVVELLNDKNNGGYPEMEVHIVPCQ